MKSSTDKQEQRWRQVAAGLREAETPVRILRSLDWPAQVKRTFFDQEARELPVVEYEPLDAQPVVEQLEEVIRPLEDDHPVDRWLLRSAESIRDAARMLAAVGTPSFHEWSAKLYGTPQSMPTDGVTPALGLAKLVHASLDASSAVDLGAPPPACHLADAVAAKIRQAVEIFGDDKPEVQVVEDLSANALAGPRLIRLRRDACFTDRDADQLVYHEAMVHVATSLNGRYQEELPILGAGHAGTTATQEGLAVFSELISGSIDTDRLRRLADRVLAIQNVIDGADFLDVYRFFLERSDDPSQSFENTRRVFRGGVVTGGAPFTKDVVYLSGLLRVHNFLRVAIAGGRADCVRLLFCGKLDLEDLPALMILTEAGLCRPPRHLPAWASDMRYLVAALSFSAFLDQVDLSRVREHYRELLGP